MSARRQFARTFCKTLSAIIPLCFVAFFSIGMNQGLAVDSPSDTDIPLKDGPDSFLVDVVGPLIYVGKEVISEPVAYIVASNPQIPDPVYIAVGYAIVIPVLLLGLYLWFSPFVGVAKSVLQSHNASES